jgi:hypothetical protein
MTIVIITLFSVLLYVISTLAVYHMFKLINNKGPGDYFHMFKWYHYVLTFTPGLNSLLVIPLGLFGWMLVKDP